MIIKKADGVLGTGKITPQRTVSSVKDLRALWERCVGST